VNLLELARNAGLDEARLPKNSEQTQVVGLALDSRALQPGFLFAAMRGQQVHGRKFVPLAITKGASVLLTDAPVSGVVIPQWIVPDPALVLAKLAAAFYPQQPQNLVAVTGTNGKSSTVEFLRQIWQFAGRNAACIGTLGITTQTGCQDLGYTTPNSIVLHQKLQDLSERGVTDCALEASSHGLVQHRLDGVQISAAGFTNLSQDHFDYHIDFENYFAAKQGLFLRLLPKGAPVVINVDDEYGARLAGLCAEKGLDVWRMGWSGVQIKLLEIQPVTEGQQIQFKLNGAEHEVVLPLVGEFQTINALMALGLAVRTGTAPTVALAALAGLSGVKGRLELAAVSREQVPILVDFAHSPDGLQKLLQSVRAYTKGRVIVVFGCGGARDPHKRPMMGQIATKYADLVIVTDDNPRSEDPKKIRAAILKQAPDALEIEDRQAAIQCAIDQAKAGDLIVVTGKGHEQGQIIGNKVFPFDDAEIIRALVGDI